MPARLDRKVSEDSEDQFVSIAAISPEARRSRAREHAIRNKGVGGSNPSCGISKFNNLRELDHVSPCLSRGDLGRLNRRALCRSEMVTSVLLPYARRRFQTRLGNLPLKMVEFQP
jgi:hypothetical protein